MVDDAGRVLDDWRRAEAVAVREDTNVRAALTLMEAEVVTRAVTSWKYWR
jgi:hypothetical protein